MDDGKHKKAGKKRLLKILEEEASGDFSADEIELHEKDDNFGNDGRNDSAHSFQGWNQYKVADQIYDGTSDNAERESAVLAGWHKKLGASNVTKSNSQNEQYGNLNNRDGTEKILAKKPWYEITGDAGETKTNRQG